MFLLAFGLTSLGVVIANRVRSFEGFGVFSNVVILPLYFLSSSIFPLEPVAHHGADQRGLSGMAGDAGRSSIRSPMRSMRCAAPSSISTSSIRGSARSCWSRWRSVFFLIALRDFQQF